MRKLTLLTILMPFLLAACNTTQGVGKDIQSAGEAVEDVAK